MGLFTKTKKIPEEELAPPTPAQVKSMLDKARPLVRHDSYFPSISTVEPKSPIPINDTHSHGIWMCCCGYHNTLVYHEGAYPFKKMACVSCYKVLCADCVTTDIVLPLQDADHATIEKLGLLNLRAAAHDLFQICPDCGLSVRAQVRKPDYRGERLCWAPVASHSHSEMCHSCNASAKSDWLKFRIGDSKAFCADPTKATLNLMLARKNKAAASSERTLEHANSTTKKPERRRVKWLDLESTSKHSSEKTFADSQVTPATAYPLSSLHAIRGSARQGLPPVYSPLPLQDLAVPVCDGDSPSDVVSPQPIRPELPYVMTREWQQLNSPQCQLKRTPRTARGTRLVRQNDLLQRHGIDSPQGTISSADWKSSIDDPTPRAAMFPARPEPSQAPDEETWTEMRSALDSIGLAHGDNCEDVYRLASKAGMADKK